jgi:3-oxoadipate enol-lactonase
VMGSSRWDGYDRIQGITAPTLVVHGELDALVPPQNGRTIAGRIPGAELVIIPDANHVLMTDQPEYVSKVLVGWLERNR